MTCSPKWLPRLLLTVAASVLLQALPSRQEYEKDFGLIGTIAKCYNEGHAVHLGILDYSPCVTCKCWNKTIMCQMILTPSICETACSSAYYRNYRCCKACQGCSFQGRYYANGKQWWDADSPCYVHVCRNGMVTLSRQQCHAPCPHPQVPLPGQCCPSCQGCSLHGRLLQEGDAVPFLDDPCVVCRCANGSLSCARQVCPFLECSEANAVAKPGQCCRQCKRTAAVPKEPPKPSGKATCRVEGAEAAVGERVFPDSCTSCVCRKTTRFFCQRKSCPVLTCPRHMQITSPSACCATCGQAEQQHQQQQPATAGCARGNQFYEEGDTWLEGQCSRCSCKQGKVQCRLEPCAQPDCPRGFRKVKLQNGCCHKCEEEDGTCTVFGDPHYRSFDGKLFHFQGSCKYVLSQDCSRDAFSIRVINEARGSGSFSWTKAVSLRMNGTRITLGQLLRVKVNGTRVGLPHLDMGRFSIIQEKGMVAVRANIGIKLLWDGNSFLEVSAAPSYKGRLCGLCGNYNRDRRDDFRTPSGTAAGSAASFGSSWRVGGRRSCLRRTPPTSSSAGAEGARRNRGRCEGDSLAEATHRCQALKAAPFDACHAVVRVSPYVRSCRQDVCDCGSSGGSDCHCQALTAYARRCEREGVPVTWRNRTGCADGGCAPGMVRGACANCQRTCRNAHKPRRCRRPCAPGCQCPPGKVLFRKQCIDPETCPKT